MKTRGRALLGEAIQLLPIVSFALPFIVRGEVALDRAGGAFALGAALTVPSTALVLFLRRLINPILAGVAIWLWVGALAFNLPIPVLADYVSRAQSFGLFLAVFAVGLVATLRAPHGFIGHDGSDSEWLRGASWALLAFAALAMGWAWWFRHDIRVGGGVPFIALNVARRVLIRRAPRQVPAVGPEVAPPQSP